MMNADCVIALAAPSPCDVKKKLARTADAETATRVSMIADWT
jgi:hypothetical protein